MERLIYSECHYAIEGQIVPQLRAFFSRLRRVRQDLGVRPYLNRIQRERCRANLLELERLEREFHRVDYPEDFEHLHRKLRRYLYLESEDLARVLGRESVRKCSLFLI
ncbi:hypothetical protein [Nitratifractor sp.]